VLLAKDRKGVLARQCIGEIAEVDAGDDLLRRQVCDELPRRLTFELRPEVPNRIHDRRRREMDDALLRSDPAELAFAAELAPAAGEVRRDRLERPAQDDR